MVLLVFACVILTFLAIFNGSDNQTMYIYMVCLSVLGIVLTSVITHLLIKFDFYLVNKIKERF